MPVKNLTCTICPLGCLLDVSYEENPEIAVHSVSNNKCPRGELYARKELLNPTRTLTTTIAVKGGDQPLVPVKTESEIPKNMLMRAMEIIRRVIVPAPVKRGDVLVCDILGTGVAVISCADVAAQENKPAST